MAGSKYRRHTGGAMVFEENISSKDTEDDVTAEDIADRIRREEEHEKHQLELLRQSPEYQKMILKKKKKRKQMLLFVAIITLITVFLFLLL